MKNILGTTKERKMVFQTRCYRCGFQFTLKCIQKSHEKIIHKEVAILLVTMGLREKCFEVHIHRIHR